MSFQQQKRPPQYGSNKPKKKNILLDVFLFPWKISRAYSKQAKKIRKIIKIAEAGKKKGIVEDCEYRLRRQNWLKFTMVSVPMYIGFLISLGLGMKDRDAFISYKNAIQLSFPTTPKNKVELKQMYLRGGKFKHLKSRIKAAGVPPFKLYHALPLAAGYLVSFFGALSISMNRAFNVQEKLTQSFIKRKMVDQDDNPWPVAWTPTAILIEGWLIDGDTLLDKKEIWAEAGFSPDCCLKDPKNPATFVLAESQDLPKSVLINFDEGKISQITKDAPKAIETSLEAFKKEIESQS